MEGAVIVRDGVGMTRVAESPIKASVCSSEVWKGKGVASLKRLVTNNVGVSGFVIAVIGSSGGVSVGHWVMGCRLLA